jgi:hypothetical protein
LELLAKAFSLASGLGRLAIGAGLFSAPRFALRTLGFSDATDATVAVARIAGGRDLVMGAETLAALAAGDRDRLRRANFLNAGADTGDAVTFAAAYRAGGEMRDGALRGFPMAALAAVGGAVTAALLHRGR